MNYLSRIGVANSVARFTSFAGQINANHGINVIGGESTDTLNSSYISLNGIDINNIFQSISGMTIYLTKQEASNIYQQLGNYMLAQDINKYVTISSLIISNNTLQNNIHFKFNCL